MPINTVLKRSKKRITVTGSDGSFIISVAESYGLTNTEVMDIVRSIKAKARERLAEKEQR